MAQLAPEALASVIDPDAPAWGMLSDGVTLKVELALGWANDPSFTLDDPTLGKLDSATLGSADAPWFDVSCDVRSLEWASGATAIDGLLTRWEAGTASIVLGNEDGRYNTADKSKRLLPMVRVRITATWNLNPGTVYPLWYGYTDSFVMTWDTDLDSTVLVTATDGTKLLGSYNAPALADPGVGDGESAAQRAKRILDAASWPDGLGFSPNDGGTLRGPTTMAEDSWTQLLLNQDAELGATYIDRNGVFVFKPRDVWVTQAIGSGSYDAHFGPSDKRYENVTIKASDESLRNIVYAARPGGTQQTVRDDGSVAQFLPHTYGRDDLPFTTDADSASWANLVLQTSSEPEARIESLELLPQIAPSDLWPVILSTAGRYGARWLVTIQSPFMAQPVVAPCQVRGWKHTVDRTQWRSVFSLMQAPVIVPFTLDGTDDAMTLDSMRLSDSAITSIVPAQGVAAGNTAININGKGFAGATKVQIGGVTMNASLITDTKIAGYTPAHAVGPVSVVVTTPTGIIQSYLGFTYQ